ncbi:VWA domain-containing protein [Haloferula sp.]|uniref:VWA domain-containing protein n=1 Tax=Haloferula sp. TaxID=2497595 RepID=UPI003C76FBC4
MTFDSLDHLPWIALALAILGLAAWFAFSLRRRTFRALADSPEGSALRSFSSPRRRRFRFFAAFAAVIFIAITLLRPIAGYFLSNERFPARNVILVIDVSKSMGCADADGLTRLEAARFFASTLIDVLPSERIGILSFSGASFPECPLTIDRRTLSDRLDRLSPGIIPVAGTDLQAALEEAGELLTEEPPPGSAIILLSDGDRLTSDVAKATEKLKERGVPIHTAVFGDPTTASAIPNSRDDQESQANPELMSDIAQATDGVAANGSAARVDASIARIRDALDTLSIEGLSDQENIRRRPNEIYFYPLAVAVLLLFMRLFLDPRSRKARKIFASLLIIFAATTTLRAEEEVYAPYQAALTEAKESDRPLMLLFIGSDWSEASIAFEREILRHESFTTWEAWRIVRLDLDLPRSGIEAEERKARRRLAVEFSIDSYPCAVFIDAATGEEIGRLHHEPDGPATWLRNADRILSGDKSASDSKAKISELPEAERDALADESMPPTLRSTLHYNRAMEELRLDEEGVIASEDRTALVTDLLESAARIAPKNRPDLTVAALEQLAILSHRRGAHVFAEKPQPPAQPETAWKKALSLYRKALDYHRDASSRASSANPELPGILARLRADIITAERHLSFQKNYAATVEATQQALASERALVRAAQLWSAAEAPLNDLNIDNSLTKIRDLSAQAHEISHPSSKDVDDALEDIEKAPAPHADRDFIPSEEHIRDALNHLMKNVSQQPQPSQGSGDPEEGEPQEPRQDQDDQSSGDAESQDEGSGGDSPQERELDDARGRQGDLQRRLRDRLGKGGKKGTPLPDH